MRNRRLALVERNAVKRVRTAYAVAHNRAEMNRLSARIQAFKCFADGVNAVIR